MPASSGSRLSPEVKNSQLKPRSMRPSAFSFSRKATSVSLDAPQAFRRDIGDDLPGLGLRLGRRREREDHAARDAAVAQLLDLDEPAVDGDELARHLVVQLLLALDLSTRACKASASARSSLMRSACSAPARRSRRSASALQRLGAQRQIHLEAHHVVGEVVGRGEDGDVAGGAARRGDADAVPALERRALALHVEVGVGGQPQRRAHGLADQAEIGGHLVAQRIAGAGGEQPLQLARGPGGLRRQGRRVEGLACETEVVAGTDRLQRIGRAVGVRSGRRASGRARSAARRAASRPAGRARRACCRGRSPRPSPAHRAPPSGTRTPAGRASGCRRSAPPGTRVVTVSASEAVGPEAPLGAIAPAHACPGLLRGGIEAARAGARGRRRRDDGVSHIAPDRP